MRNFTFRRLKATDLPLMRSWLEAAHVKAWWPDAERQIGAMLKDIDNAQINMLMVCLIEHPFAYIQDYDAHGYGQPQYADLPRGARVLDTFVGDSGFMGQGHSSGYIEARVRELRLNAPIVAVGPDTKDIHAISVYSHAGFRKRQLVPAPDGRLIQVMTHL